MKVAKTTWRSLSNDQRMVKPHSFSNYYNEFFILEEQIVIHISDHKDDFVDKEVNVKGFY